MLDLQDPNIPYLIGGLLAFWLPVLGYWWALRVRAAQLAEEDALLREELREMQ